MKRRARLLSAGERSLMAYIKFKNSDKLVQGSVLPVLLNTVRITADLQPNVSGFRLYLDADAKYPLDSGEYESFTTLYRQGDSWFELSNDGSVYTEPEEVTSVQPTEEELAELERQKQISALNEQISTLKSEIESTDYQIIKTYEYTLVGLETEYDITALHKQRQALRDQINELEVQLADLIIE